MLGLKKTTYGKNITYSSAKPKALHFLYVERIKVWKNIKSHPNTYYQTLLLLFS